MRVYGTLTLWAPKILDLLVALILKRKEISVVFTNSHTHYEPTLINWDNQCSPLLLGYEQVVSTRWLADPNQGHIHFPHKFYSSYEYLIPNQSDNSHAHELDTKIPPVC